MSKHTTSRIAGRREYVHQIRLRNGNKSCTLHVMGQLTDAITAAVKASNETPGAIAKGAGVARSQLSRMMRGKSGMNSETIEQLADYLGLEIVIRAKRTRKER